MATKEQVTKAVAAIQAHIDRIIHQYATSGVPVMHPATSHDYKPLIDAITARDLLKREGGT
jgi:hypothetical protein